MSVPVEHLILDDIDNAIARYQGTDDCVVFVNYEKWTRLSECIEFQDEDGEWFEIVVRPIEAPKPEETDDG